MHRLGLWERYHKERYRKWVENVIGSGDDRLRTDAARYVARQFGDAASPPVTVHLILRWTDLELARSPSGQVLGTALLDRRVPHAHPSSELLFRYAVRPEDRR